MATDDQASAQMPTRSSALWVLGVFGALFVLFFFRAVPLTLDPARSTNAPDQFDVTRAIERLGKVLDGTPHPVDRRRSTPCARGCRRRSSRSGMSRIARIEHVPRLHLRLVDPLRPRCRTSIF